MADLLKETLLRQLELAWKLTTWHLEGLTDEEVFFRPAPQGLHVRQAPEGGWRADWPEREDYGIGPASIAWLTWHLGFFWSMTLDHSFGDGRLSREEVLWPGDARAVILWLKDLHRRWRAHLEGLTPEELHSVKLSRWPFRERPFADVLAWVNVELTKNAAEIGYVRFLHAAAVGTKG
jgi:hypothetical protein